MECWESHERGILVLYLFWVQLMVPVYSQLSNTSTLGIVHLFGLKRGLVPLVYSWRLVLSNPKRDFTKSEWTIHDQLRRQHFFFFKKTNFRDKYHYPKRPKVSSILEVPILWPINPIYPCHQMVWFSPTYSSFQLIILPDFYKKWLYQLGSCSK